MDWDDLRFFLAVASAGSLSGAAQQLGVNTTTVLRRVASLEGDLSARLFERERTGYRLTAAGERLAEALEPVDRRLSALPRDFAASAGKEGLVRVAISEVLALCVVGPELAAFRERYPGLELELVGDMAGNAAGMGARLGHLLKDVDMALRVARPTQGDMLMRKIGDMAYGLYASPAYLERRGTPAVMADLASHEMIGFPRTEIPLGPVWWMSHAERSSHIALRSSSVMLRAQAAREGIGLAALPCVLGEAEASLQRVFGPDVLGSLELWLTTRNDLAQLAHVRAVMEFLADAVRRHRSRLDGRLREITEFPSKPLKSR